MRALKNKFSLLILSIIVLVASMYMAMSSMQSAYASSSIISINDKQEFLDFITFANEEDTLGYDVFLEADIDFEGDTIPLILDFYGTFHGQNNIIENLVVGSEFAIEPIGVFSVNNGIIQNLIIRSGKFYSSTVAGGIAGENNGVIDGCVFDGSHIFSSDYGGGIVGKNNGTIRNSSAKAFTYLPLYSGGIAGENSGIIENCYSMGNTNAKIASGGIAGVSSGEINNSYSRGITTLYAEENDATCGGIVGSLQQGGSINNSYCAEDILAEKESYTVYTGAIVGLAEYDSEIENCYYDFAITVSENNDQDKGGWAKNEFDEAFGITNIVALTARDMSGAENLIGFTDLSQWIFLPDNLLEGVIYYPQLSFFYINEILEIKAQSILSVSKACDVSTVTLYDDYGTFLSQYNVFSGEERLPDLIEKIGFTTKGWSATIDGSIIDAQALIVEDTTLYAVYEFEPMSYSFNNLTTTYGEDKNYSVFATHSTPDTVITYEWHKMDGANAVLIEGATNSFITLRDCSDSGYYQAKAIATNGKYSTYEYDTKRVTINPYTFDIPTPIFSKTYGQEEEGLTQQYNVNIGTEDEVVEVLFSREIGENAGSYDILSVESINPNFSANLIGDTENRYIINKADYTYSFSFISEVFTYDGQEHMLDYEENLPIGLEIIISMIGDGTNAGEHYLSANFNGDFDNYNTIEAVNATMYIQKANYAMNEVHFNSIGTVYDGEVHNIFMTGSLPLGVTATYSNIDIKNAGVHPVRITFSGDYDNYNPIGERSATLTILPKGLRPIFDLPDNMIEDGNEKEITITAEGIVDGDEVIFSLNSSHSLIEAGNYTITAVIENTNYILYDENAMIKIYSPFLENSEDNDIDATIRTEKGINPDYNFRVEKRTITENMKKRLGADKVYEGFNLSLLFDETETDLLENSTVKIAIPENIKNMTSIELLFYNTENDSFKKINMVIENGYMIFNTETLGFYIIIGANTAIVSDLSYINDIRYILFGLLIIITILIIILIILIVRNRKVYKQSLVRAISIAAQGNSILTPLTDEERKRLYKRMRSGEFVDWELNRDLKNYAIWSDYLNKHRKTP